VSVTSRTGLECLSAVARHHGIDLPVDRLLHNYAVADSEVSTRRILRMAKDAGLRARSVTLGWGALATLRDAYPIMAQLENGNWVVITNVCQGEDQNSARVSVFDPLAQPDQTLILPQAQFCKAWGGKVILLKRTYKIADEDRPFGFLWFAPEFLRQRRLFGNVVLAAIMLYGLGLATPIFFQLIIDKVLVHQSIPTLYVLTLGIATALLFDAAFTFVRRYLLLYATNKIDVRTATRSFGHLLGLPITFFEQAPAGVLVKHMQQAARIREFLSGRLFLTLLDGLSLLIFVPVLLLYSAKLTLVVVAFTALVGLVVALLVGPFRLRLRSLYEAEGKRQALLVESVHGMRTIKALAMEPIQRRNWDDQSAQAIDMRFRVEKIAAMAQSITGLIEKLMVVAIIWIGAIDVFSGSLSIGALIAFNMLASRVSGPLVQLVTMTHEYQDVALSVRMMGGIMNQRTEQATRIDGLRPVLKGQIEFENVSFRYAAEGHPALDGISAVIPAGSVFGIVGKSGSGKTTLTRLMLGLYPLQHGLLRIDGTDIRQLDLTHLRKSIGVVLQDSFLFRGTVAENIAAAKPNATFEEVVSAARLAGAEQFIERLPRGFDTMIEEGAANLSGGERQRIAIARALVTNPRILIFDEATSALDPDTEMIIRSNLRQISEGRTVIIISHRLSTLVDADSILVLDRGRFVDFGRHEHLITSCATYRQLWNQQTRQAA